MFAAGSTCRKSEERSRATYRWDAPLLLLKARYAWPSSSTNTDWSPDMPVTTFPMVDWVPALVKWPFGVLLVANTRPPSSWEISTYLPVVGLRATPIRPTQPPAEVRRWSSRCPRTSSAPGRWRSTR